MKIFNRVKSLLNRYLCRYQKGWVYLHIGWVFLAMQLVLFSCAQPWDLLFMVLAVTCFILSMTSNSGSYFRYAENQYNTGA